jgi:hypothetical protein
VAKKDKEKHSDEVVDLQSRIGGRAPASQPKEPAKPRDPDPVDAPARLDGPLPPRRGAEQRVESRPFAINPSEPPAPIGEKMASLPASDEDEKTEPIPSPRTPPGPGETDVVITPLPTLDDWHRFELALRKVRGIGQVKTEYYRHGVLKVRVSYEGRDRLSQALRSGIPGYRVRVIGEGATTLQILVSSDSDERRPG